MKKCPICEKGNLLKVEDIILPLEGYVFKGIKKRNQYDEFLHKIQQAKMKELWDNKDDDVWENA